MNMCKDLIEQFRKSTNGETFKIKYKWNYDERGYYYESKIIGIYDNKTCNMTIDEETTLSDDKLLTHFCRFDTLYSISLEMKVPSYCEIKIKK